MRLFIRQGLRFEKKIENCGKCPDYPCEKMNMVFQKTEDFRKIFEHACTKEEFALFEKAFFKKKVYLDEAAKKGIAPRLMHDSRRRKKGTA